MEGRSLHRKCTGDHEHIPIQGQYTKPSYTDELAEAVADRFDVALKAKLRTLLSERPSVGGLENLLCNDVLLSGQWSTDAVWRWKKPLHIKIQETLTVVHFLKSLAVSQPRSRPVLVMDSNVGLSALVKGRSSLPWFSFWAYSYAASRSSYTGPSISGVYCCFLHGLE